uniref:type III pantothenate kinase n=1 Tax=Ezakiella massiliensis TaxID=1852374 RepID=UPI00094EDF22|nr:type III pantothenate kinase [Ezakiella massiliensis]
MILTIDIGNTNTVLGIYEGYDLKVSIRISSDSKKTVDEIALFIDQIFTLRGVDVTKIQGAILSSVVPMVTDNMIEAVKMLTGLEPIVVGPGTKTGLNVLYDDPKEVGADRIVNAVGGIDKYGAPLIIIDFGTATTYCVVDEKSNYLGGIISPGIGISAEALFMKAAKLPKVDLTVPESFLNRNTVDAIRAGLMYGAIGQVDYIVKHLKAEENIDAKVIATGGLAKVIASKTEVIDLVDDELTLWGLRKIYDKNAKHRG